jgi:glucose-1-phosphate thymidylyltransferase
MDGWRIDVGYPEDREAAERRLREEATATGEAVEASTDASAE